MTATEVQMSTAPRATTATPERVVFESEREAMTGLLFAAGFGEAPAPAIAILGPMTFQKEQAPMLYARRLSQLGYAALVFDPRFRGESGGEPRCYESPAAKVADLRSALRYLSGRPEIDSERLAVLGICMGASHVLPAAADDPLVRAVAMVTGQYRDAAADAAWLGSETAVAERLRRGQVARERYEATDELEYVPAVDAERTDVGMPGQLPWSWYQLWADRGGWENRYAVMSDAALFEFESISAAARLTKPALMIHSDLCALPNAARRHFAVIPTADKRLVWEGQTRHLQYYDDPDVIDRAVYTVVDWLATHLGPGSHITNASQNGSSSVVQREVTAAPAR
jgi:dienelactone hydrolase